jgi:uncharacterized protein (DUF58 family)
MNRQAIRDFFITVFFLGLAFVIAILSSIAAEQSNPTWAAIAAAISLLLATIGAIYIIPRLARNVRLEMLRFSVRTSVTKEGILFFVFLVVIGFSAWNTGNNLLYLVLSAMIAFLFAANLIGRLSVSDLSVQLRFPDHIFAGEEATLNVRVTNHKRFMPSYSFVVEALSDADDAYIKAKREIEQAEKKEGTVGKRQSAEGSRQKAEEREEETSIAASLKESLGKLEYFLLVPAQASARKRIHHTFPKRGLYRITGFRIASKFPAGFFEKWKRIDAAGEIVVYPKPQPLDDFYHTLPMLAGQIQAQTRGTGDELYAIRRYQPADQVRHIDWKATAKLSELMVREKMREDERRLTIVFDTVRRSTNLKNEAAYVEQFERAVIRAASLAHHFILEQSEVELITPDEQLNVPSGSGQNTLYDILRSLATIEPTGTPIKTEAEEAPEKPRRFWRTFLQKQLDFQLRRSERVKQQLTAEIGNFRRAYLLWKLRLIQYDIRYFSRILKNKEAQAIRLENREQGISLPEEKRQWQSLDKVPILMNERRFKVLITSAPKGSIPAGIWRSAHVMYLEDM